MRGSACYAWRIAAAHLSACKPLLPVKAAHRARLAASIGALYVGQACLLSITGLVNVCMLCSIDCKANITIGSPFFSGPGLYERMVVMGLSNAGTSNISVPYVVTWANPLFLAVQQV